MARRTHSVTPLGARFDMEADAFLILVLSVAAAPVVGWWVLAIGFARYALLLAERVWPWLRAPVPPRYWRKVVAAVQGVTLAVVVTGLVPTVEAVAFLLVAPSGCWPSRSDATSPGSLTDRPCGPAGRSLPYRR